MQTDNVVWSNPTIVKVTGEAARTGLVTSREGKQFPFVSKDMKAICSNFKEVVPLYFSHDDKTAIGFVSKVGYDSTTDKVQLEGFVTDSKKCEQIQKDGYNKISPELDIDVDEKTGEIKNIFMSAGAFVKKAMFDNSPVMTIPVCFGDPIETPEPEIKTEVKPNMAEPIVKTNPDGTYSITIGTSTTPSAPVTPLPVFDEAAFAAKIKADIVRDKVDPMKSELEIAKNAASEYQTKYNGIITEKITSGIEELKSLGFTKPEEIGVNLPVDQRLELIKSIKSNFVKAAPPTNTNIPPVQIQTPSGQDALMQAAKKELGIGNMFDKYLN